MFGFGSRKNKKPSLFKRLLYLIVVLSSGGGFAGWSLKDYPQVQAILTAVVGDDGETLESLESLDAATVKGKVASAVVDVIKQKVQARDDFGQPGVYQVAIPKVQLDAAAFKDGQRIDIQAKVLKLDPKKGRDATIWESKPFGERLAIVGKDELVAGWPHRPFQVNWSPGEQLVVEVYDHRAGLFVQPRRYALAPPGPDARGFPLKTGSFALVPFRVSDPAQESRKNQIEFVSRRVGDLEQKNSTQVAERPIVIK